MCDYSLKSVKSRPASVGDKLVTHNFGYGTRGFAEPGAGHCADDPVAICVLPGTELAFAGDIECRFPDRRVLHKTAIFRQINTGNQHTHHDALEFPNGETCLLTHLEEGQSATVLQLPAALKTSEEAKEQTRLEVVG
jgi:hypothetical protein